MEFRVDCPCGEQVVVSEAAAGSSRRCACGRDVAIASLKELRVQAGLPAYNVSPELLIEYQLSSGELPFGPRCGQCGKETTDIVRVITECERGWSDEQGLSWVSMLLLMFFFPMGIWVWILSLAKGGRADRGSDKIYTLPLRACAGCRGVLSGQATIKQCLRTVSSYALLLEKFSDAKVRLGEP